MRLVLRPASGAGDGDGDGNSAAVPQAGP
jgi:hypothetical protein